MCGSNVCFLRKKQGHYQKDYPKIKQPIKGRVFSMNHDQMDPNSAIVTGMISIASFPAHVLIDTGATHSYMFVKFMTKLVLVLHKSLSGFGVVLPSGEELRRNSVVRDCKIQIQGHNLCEDFIVFYMPNFDVIVIKLLLALLFMRNCGRA
ncbi:uncharacterized protein [Henckelia pumila]|uniref:uncharacterized protein n=1 Tax=Henckelia pumila TaxID=405737 RepID=UPI003C6DC918